MKVAFFPADNGGCGHVRMRLPAKALAAKGHKVAVISNFLLADGSYDAYVFQRVMEPNVLEGMKYLTKRGKVVVHDLDDAFDALPIYNAVRKGIQAANYATLWEAMRTATLCTFSTPELRNRYVARGFKKTVVLPNCIDIADYFHVTPGTDQGITIGWAGSATHSGDLDILRGVLSQIHEDYGDKVFFYFVGQDNPKKILGFDKIMHRPPVPMNAYPEQLSPINIGLVPLAFNEFNRCKSDIKFLEYAAHSIPTIASPLPAYQRMARKNAGLVLASRPKDWLRELHKLIDDEDLRAERGAAVRAYAESMDIHANIHLWEGAYAGCLDENRAATIAV